MADPAAIHGTRLILLLSALFLYVTMVYGPLAAYLVELFPTRIRYTSMSLPYHIGNGWFGGFLPLIASSIVVATGNIYAGLWFPIAVAIVSVLVSSFCCPNVTTANSPTTQRSDKATNKTPLPQACVSVGAKHPLGAHRVGEWDPARAGRSDIEDKTLAKHIDAVKPCDIGNRNRQRSYARGV